MKQKHLKILRNTRLFIAIILLAAMAGLTSCKKTDDVPAKPIKYNFSAIPQKSLWLDVAKSQFVIAGTFQVDTIKLKEILETESGYLNFTLSIDSVLKGDLQSKELSFTKYIEKPLSSNDSNLFLLNGKKSIDFFIENPANDGPLFMLGNIGNSLISKTEDTIKVIANEVKRQQEITDDKTFFSICPNDKNSARVKELIADMHNGTKANDAYIELEKMGFNAVPGMICQMDDRREIAQKHISLENNYPDAWEAYRHYSPKVVVDVLEAILNQITGQSFGFIENGGTEEERANTVRGWRTYLWHAANDSLEQKQVFQETQKTADSACTFDTRMFDSIEWMDESLPFEINGNHLIIQKRKFFLQGSKTLSKKGIISFSKDKKYAKVTQAIQRKGIFPTLGYSLFEFKSDTLKRCNLIRTIDKDSLMEDIDKTTNKIGE